MDITSGLIEAMIDIVTNIKSIPYPDIPNTLLFKKVDIWDDQLNREVDASGYTFPTPACFLEMKQISSKEMGMGYNLIDYEVIFHIIDNQLNRPGVLDQNLKVFILRDLVKHKFQLFQPKQMGTLMFIKDEQDYTHTNTYHYKETFKGALIDSYGNSFPIVGSASEVLTVSYNFHKGVGVDIIGKSLIVYP